MRRYRYEKVSALSLNGLIEEVNKIECCRLVSVVAISGGYVYGILEFKEE